VCYYKTVWGQFVYDDVRAVVNNRDVSNPMSFLDLFHHDFWGMDVASDASHKSYRPLTVLTFRLNYVISGFNPSHFRLTNLLLHLVTITMFSHFSRHVIQLNRKWSCVAGMWFAVLPIHSEA
ncbi:hypothetical protein HELRODRAFT_142417, partial [Helobdella robusta]|uniref:Uncharacterized protein n=1 Tax=Helobdella robusta TaxID=6412 RepID=T1EJ56_HELRO